MHYAHVEVPHVVIQSPAGLGQYSISEIPDAEMELVRAPNTNGIYWRVIAHGSSGKVEELVHQKTYRLGAAIKKWQRYLLDPNAPADVDALTETVEAALEMIAEFGPNAFSLEGVQVGSAQCEHLAAVLRASSSWSDDVPGWSSALEVARQSALAAGLEPEDVLYGMI
jgi:hypothetical protein